MVDIIENLKAPYTKEDVFVFKVYKSPKDGETILGYMEPFGVIHSSGTAATWISTEFGVPVKEAFDRVLALANEHGMAAVLVDDPNGYFPPEKRR